MCIYPVEYVTYQVNRTKYVPAGGASYPDHSRHSSAQAFRADWRCLRPGPGWRKEEAASKVDLLGRTAGSTAFSVVFGFHWFCVWDLILLDFFWFLAGYLVVALGLLDSFIASILGTWGSCGRDSPRPRPWTPSSGDSPGWERVEKAACFCHAQHEFKVASSNDWLVGW